MNSDIENKDWLNDYASLKQINPANPFTVPAGYFDDLEDRMLSRKNLDELAGEISSDGFGVPENYFSDLTANIKSRVVVENALSIGNNAFIVPEGYFENLEQQIKSRVLIEQAIGDSSEYFAVPQDYFTGLNKNILDKTINADQLNSRGIVRKMFASNVFKYATAACFALVIGAGVLLTQITNPANAHKNSFLHKQLSNVPIDEISNYLKLNVDAGDTQQTVMTQGAPVDDDKLKNALQDYVDSVQ